MRVSTLACDFCKAQENAVVTVRLSREPSDGRRNTQGPTLDLCRLHLRALEKVFAPRKRTKAGLVKQPAIPARLMAAVEAKRGLDWARAGTRGSRNAARDRRRAEASARLDQDAVRSGKRAWGEKGKAYIARKQAEGQAVRQERAEAILAVLRKADHRLARPEIDKETGLAHHAVAPVLRALVRDGAVTRYSKGPHARYELASKARHGDNEHAA